MDYDMDYSGLGDGNGDCAREAVSNYVDAWQVMEDIRTVVEANHYRVWDLRQTSGGFRLELDNLLGDDEVCMFCGQFSISADYEGDGDHGSVFFLRP